VTKFGAEVESKSLLDDQYQSMVDLNPGISFITKNAFDVAKNDPLIGIEFHNSMFSGGVIVDLTKTLKKKLGQDCKASLINVGSKTKSASKSSDVVRAVWFSSIMDFLRSIVPIESRRRRFMYF
jgi:hypothetical protein